MSVSGIKNQWRNKYYTKTGNGKGYWDKGFYDYVQSLGTDDGPVFNPDNKYGVIVGDIAPGLGNPDNSDDPLNSSPNYDDFIDYILDSGKNSVHARILTRQYKDYLEGLEKKDEEEGEVIDRTYSPLEALRFAPIIGSGLGIYQSLKNRPDHTYPNALLEATRDIPNFKSEPLGMYMRYTPFDRMFYLNGLNALAGGTNRGILNTSGGNRGQALSGLLASD